MQSRWVRWVAYTLLAALVVVTSCQAMGAVPATPSGGGSHSGTASAGPGTEARR